MGLVPRGGLALTGGATSKKEEKTPKENKRKKKRKIERKKERQNKDKKRLTDRQTPLTRIRLWLFQSQLSFRTLENTVLFTQIIVPSEVIPLLFSPLLEGPNCGFFSFFPLCIEFTSNVNRSLAF